ncbi:DNA repair protein RadA [Skermania sp. ID1734]|uniref:DNA repair protein RadA n=1 Tax=Skermania sp. ID1734 TaxID=2597516 RepID=UPI00117D68BD|nr:DNA repair protein RadA [Skermania sp. ID1734]TSD95624.1 DNA repair protein RadA [Skermania sp. ID1734]
MTKPKTEYRCRECGHVVAKWVGKCPDCGGWGSIEESVVSPLVRSGSSRAAMLPSSVATPITAVDAQAALVKPTGVGELDRVLGGGLVPGSVVLLAGEPGVGKSTLLLEVVHNWARRSPEDRALYVTGEESAGQVRLRADRTGALHDRVYLAAESDLAMVCAQVDAVAPTLLVVDSVQTLSTSEADGVLGGVTQVRAITAALTGLAKRTGVAVVLVGHVTKEGAIAGPRTLEHLVDVVLHFEGDRHSTLRLVRGVKNRFGAADEVGCFELHDAGIVGIADPSALFLHHQSDPVPGTAVTVTMDGKRAMVAEVQALVHKTANPAPRRAVSGLDYNRVSMTVAVLGSRCGVKLFEHDVYTSTVGGMRIGEPAADLAVAVAIASAAGGTALPSGMVAIGEVGLAGEVRRVSAIGRRLLEARRLGFDRALVPPQAGPVPPGMEVLEVADLAGALRHLS